MKEPLAKCRICPHQCGVNRLAGQTGRCGVSGDCVYIARAALHVWEEPCISGERGSGTVFFSGCNLGCGYCQNIAISRGMAGKAVTVDELADIFLSLQAKGAHNLNLVTPTHYAVQIRQALLLAKQRGLTLPVVYNCGGYESVETLKSLNGLVSVYLPDFKYIDSASAQKYSCAPKYPQIAKASLAEMVNQTGEAAFDRDGMLVRGVLVRHLVLPTHEEEAKQIVAYLYQTYGHTIYMSIMNQYTPMEGQPFPELSHSLEKEAYQQVVDYAVSIGVENGFIQQGGTVGESFIPPFGQQNF